LAFGQALIWAPLDAGARKAHGAPSGVDAPLEDNMDLHIYSTILETVAMLRTEMELIGRRDPDLERQLRKAAASMALNTSEGAYSRGRNAQLRFHTALGSARETLACVEVGVALGYMPKVREVLVVRMRQILGTLTKLTR
jgi:four helix bundle protein